VNNYIWIINDYAGSPYHGMELRHYYLGKELFKKKYNVTIISSSYSHLFKNLPKSKKENIDGIDYLWLRTFNYGNAHNKRRVLKWFLFMFKCFFLPFTLKKPAVIIVSPMAPFSILPAWILAKKYGVKLIYEVKDIWPRSLVELGGFSYKHPFIKFMAWFEKFALKKSDVIVSNLQNYGEHIKELGIDRKFEWISNGIYIDDFNNSKKLPMSINSQLNKNQFIIGYIGSFGKSNAINYYLDAINRIDKKYDILFLFLGDGNLKNRISAFAKEDNRIIIIDRVDKGTAFEVMKKCNLLFKGNPASKLYEFGISPFKLFEYMLSGNPILHSTNVGNNIVQIANCGISVEAETPNAIAAGIMKGYNLSVKERDKLGDNGKKYVLEHFTYEKLAEKYQKLL
jgi:glycosyltransferase involved in cell wall biosynthesis